jgi:hypothetical protein
VKKMADRKQTDSTKKEKSQKSGFNCCTQNFEEIQIKMRNFLNSDKSPFDCCPMMQQICGGSSNVPKKSKD